MKNVLSPSSENRMSKKPETAPSVNGVSPTMPGTLKSACGAASARAARVAVAVAASGNARG